MKNRNKHNNPYIYAGLTALSVIFVTMLMVFIIFRHKDLAEGISKITKILQPVFIGAVLAYLLTPICNRIEALADKLLPESKYKKKISEILGIFLSSALALAIFVVLILLIVPATYNSIIELIQSVPSYVTNLITWINENEKLKDYPDIRRYVLNLIDTITNRFESITSIIDLTKSDFLPSIQSVLSSLGNGISEAFNVIINIVIGFIISIYLLSSRTTFARQSKMTLYAIVKPRTADMIYEEVKFADKMFSGFLRGKMVDSAIVGVICFISLRLMNFPDATLISVIVGVTNIIPVFGPFIGAIPSALLIFVAIAGRLPESSGMIVGVPLFAVIYDILKKLIFHNLRRHGKSDMISPGEDGTAAVRTAVAEAEDEASEDIKEEIIIEVIETTEGDKEETGEEIVKEKEEKENSD